MRTVIDTNLLLREWRPLTRMMTICWPLCSLA